VSVIAQVEQTCKTLTSMDLSILQQALSLLAQRPLKKSPYFRSCLGRNNTFIPFTFSSGRTVFPAALFLRCICNIKWKQFRPCELKIQVFNYFGEAC